MNKLLSYISKFILLGCCVFVLLQYQEIKAQPAYWHFSYDDLITEVKMGMSKQEIVSKIAKKKKLFGKYALDTKRLFVDDTINYVDYELLSGSYYLPEFHKLKEWYNDSTMIINYSILFVEDICVKVGLYFIYPNIEMGQIDFNYMDIVSFFSQVGWYVFCKHPLWDLDVRCGYQTNYVPMFEDAYGQGRNVRMYRHRLKIAKGLCSTLEHTLSESIQISFSDALALKKALKISSIEEAAFYGNSLFEFGLDKRVANCIN